MKKQRKKWLPLVLALLLCLCLLPVGAFAADSDFTIENGVLTKYNGSGGAVTIPNGVTKIGNEAFANCTSLTSVVIPNGVTVIDNLAFASCEALVQVTIPDSVTQIGRSAFALCTSLTSVTIPKGVTVISPFTFSGCETLTDVTIPQGVTTISDNAFINCSMLNKIVIPDSVTVLGWDAFSYCVSLTKVTLPRQVRCTSTPPTHAVADAPISYAFAETPWLRAQRGWVLVEGKLLEYCGEETNITLPDNVTALGDYAFSSVWTGENSLTVTIPARVTTISEKAFCQTNGDKISVTLYGAEGSAAQQFAKANDIPFVAGSAPAPSAQLAQPDQSQGQQAKESIQSVSIDGTKTTFQMYALVDANGGMTNYIQLRDLAVALNDTVVQFSVDYDGRISLITQKAYTPNGSEGKRLYTGNQPYKVNTNGILINGTEFMLDSFVITDSNGGGHTYFKLRDLGKAMHFNVGWSKERGVYIETDRPYFGT